MKKLIILEGIASSGKSTLMNRLRNRLRQNGVVECFPEEETLLPHVEIDNRDAKKAFAYLHDYLNRKMFSTPAEFLIADRFHFSHAFRTGSNIEYFADLEALLLERFDVLVVLLHVESSLIKSRIAQTTTQRGNDWGFGKKGTLEERTAYYIDQQNKFVSIIADSKLPNIEIDTSSMEWDKYTEEIYSKVQTL